MTNRLQRQFNRTGKWVLHPGFRAGMGLGLFILLWATSALAQETRGTVLGRVVDASGAVVPRVAVRATNAATNVTVSTQSNAEGNYEIPYLLAGIYRLTAELTGFKTFVREGIEIRIGDRISIEIALQVGAALERVTVTAETPLLELASSSMGQVIDQRRIADLPIAHGNPYLLMTLSPGVAYTQNAGLDRPFEATHIVGYSMEGVRSNLSEVTLDGTPNTSVNNRWGGQGNLMAGYTPPADIVQEFKVQTMVFDAAVGHTQGGVTSITLKSGGNQPHGTLYYSLLNPVLSANLFFANRAGQSRAPFIYNRWGASATGPVVLPHLYQGKDRTFFTYAYEGIRENRAVGAAYGRGTLTVPTEQERRGDFSALLRVGSQYQIYDPGTRAAAPGGRYAIQPFAGNIIPPARIHPVAKNILSYYSLPNVPGTADGTNNLIRVNDPQATTYYNHIARIDHNFSAGHRVFGRFNTYRRYSTSDDWFRNLSTGWSEDWKQHAFSFDDVVHLSPTTFLNMRCAYYRLLIAYVPNRDSLGFDVASLGFPKSYAEAIDPAVRTFPTIGLSSYFGGNYHWFRYPHSNMSLEGQVVSIRGSHTLKLGFDGRHYRTFQYEPQLGGTSSSTGLFTFGTTWTRGPFDNSSSSPKGQDLASLLLGLPTGGSVDRKASFAEQATYWALYFHDDWRVTPKLTLNLGLRYELEGPMTERFNRAVRGYDFQTASPLDAQVRANYANSPTPEITPAQFRLLGGLTFPGVGGLPRTLWKRDINNFMPRLGFAYMLGRKTVVRGGYGLFYGTLGIPRGDVVQYGFTQQTALIPSLDNGMTFVATLSNPFPNGIQEPRGAADGLMTYVGRSVKFFDENPATAYHQRWQLSVQRELPLRMLLEVGYAGNRGTKLETTRNLRALPPKYLSRSPVRDTETINYLTATVPNPFYPLLPGTGLSGTTVSRAYLLSSADYPHFTGLTTTTYDGYSWYHGLVTRMERRFASGWTLNAAYTWSKSMQALARLNDYLSPLEEVISPEDRPHRFSISGIWEIPVGRGRRLCGGCPAAADKIIGGWQVQGIYTAQGGPPLGFSNALFVGNIHDITLPKSQRTPDRWFNTGAGFERNSARQLAYNYRTMPLLFSDVRGDGVNLWDLSLLKNTRFRERYNIQFRAEFLNAWNHPNFSPPNTSPTSSAFGQVTSQVGYPRRIQFGLKILF